MTDIQTILTMATKCLANTSDSAWLDAEVILCHILGKPRTHLRAWPEKQLTKPQYNRFIALLKQRQQGVPIAYIIGTREFWSRNFSVDSNVLIPRPETELLLELSLNKIIDKAQAQVIDLGTGAGIIAITLAAERPDLKVFATDISHKALKKARENAAMQQIKNIHFIQSDWFNAIASTKFDLVISNPPYIASDDPHLSQGDLRFEPNTALIAADQGLQAIKTLCHQAYHYLKPDGTLLIEHGFNQQTAVQAIFAGLKYQNITTHTDLSANPRVVTGQWH